VNLTTPAGAVGRSCSVSTYSKEQAFSAETGPLKFAKLFVIPVASQQAQSIKPTQVPD
jgi:hypothetical protein